MSRLTPFARILIVVAIVAGIFFGVRHFFPNIGTTTTTPSATETTQSTSSTPAEQTASESEKKTSSGPSFNYTPTAPSGGKMKGVVELGATGFNSFIISLDAQKNWKLEKAEYGASLVYENLATDDDIKAGIKRYIAEMLAFGVSAKDIHFVISSGAKKVDITSKIISALKTMGYVVNTVTAEQEAKLALKSALPKEYYDNAFVVDIGSGNTKLSWVASGQVTGLEAPGAKYFEKNISDQTVYQDVSTKAKMVPSSHREVCFIIGGIPFELAKQTRNGKERYTVLKSPQDYKPNGAKQTSGLNIYRAVADATGCKQFVFDWDANFTIGFLLTL